MMRSIPHSLAPFFQEYDITRLNAEKDSFPPCFLADYFGNHEISEWFWNTITEDRKFVMIPIPSSAGTKQIIPPVAPVNAQQPV